MSADIELAAGEKLDRRDLFVRVGWWHGALKMCQRRHESDSRQAQLHIQPLENVMI